MIFWSSLLATTVATAFFAVFFGIGQFWARVAIVTVVVIVIGAREIFTSNLARHAMTNLSLTDDQE